MEGCQTPIGRLRALQEVHIPASPLMKKIGFGTGVAVYEMQRSPIFDKTSSPWAVKKLIHKYKNNLNLNNRLKDEAQVLRRLNHPNIVGFRAFFKDSNGKNVLAMEECTYCLGDLIEERDNPFPSKTITKVIFDTAKALKYLHNNALLMHCDIKSFNILIKGSFMLCKLCDFGVCLPVLSNGELDIKKAGEEVEYVGTPAWYAPEVLKYPQDISTMADIYALGLVIWEMIALSPPIDQDLVDSFIKTNEDDVHECSFNLSTIEEPNRKRPPLPDVDLTTDYNVILEIFHTCTNEDKNDRPTAKDLEVIMSNIVE